MEGATQGHSLSPNPHRDPATRLSETDQRGVSQSAGLALISSNSNDQQDYFSAFPLTQTIFRASLRLRQLEILLVNELSGPQARNNACQQSQVILLLITGQKRL